MTLKEYSTSDGKFTNDGNSVLLLPKQHVTVDFTKTLNTKNMVSYAKLVIGGVMKPTTPLPLPPINIVKEMTGDTPFTYTAPDNVMQVVVKLDSYRIEDGTDPLGGGGTGNIEYTGPSDTTTDGELDTETMLIVAAIIIVMLVGTLAYLHYSGGLKSIMKKIGGNK